MANGNENNNGKKTTTTTPPDTTGSNGKLKAFHSQLVNLQGSTDIEGIPEDYGQFESAFQDPEYRKRFHDFLIYNQGKGRVSQIPDNFEEFQRRLMGQPEGGSDGEGANVPGYMQFDQPPSGSDLPKPLQQLDLELSQVEDQAFDSTAKLDELDSLEKEKAIEARKAGKAIQDYLQGDQYDLRREQRLEQAREEEGEAMQQVDELAGEQPGGDPFFTRSGGLQFERTPEQKYKLTKARERLESIRDTKNFLLEQKETRFQQAFGPLERLGFKWEAGKGQIKSAMQGFELSNYAEHLEMMNNIDRGIENETISSERLGFSAPLPPTVRAYQNADPEKRKQIKAKFVSRMADKVEDLMGLQEAISEIPQNPYAEELINAETAEQAWDTFKQSPIDIISTLGITSLPFSGASIVGGTLGGLVGGPVGAGAGAGLGSGTMEYMASLTEGIMREVQKDKGYTFEDIISELDSQGINTDGITPGTLFAGEHSKHLKKLLGEDAQQTQFKKKIMAVLEDPKAMDRVKDFARKRAFSIGALDAAGTFLPVKGLTNTLTKNAAKATTKGAKATARAGIAGSVSLGITLDAMAGGMGEALAQLVTNGDLEPGEISAELIGELIGGPVEIAGATSTSIMNEMGYDGFRDFVRGKIQEIKGRSQPDQAGQIDSRIQELEAERQQIVSESDRSLEELIAEGPDQRISEINDELAELRKQRRDLERQPEASPEVDIETGPEAEFSYDPEAEPTQQIDQLEGERQRLQEQLEVAEEETEQQSIQTALERIASIQDELKAETAPAGPEIEETPEAQQRISEALGQATGTQQVVPETDVRGEPILSPEEFNELSEEQRSEYTQTITQPITTPEGSEIEVDYGIAPFLQRISDLGVATGQSDSGMKADHPGQRYVEGERQGQPLGGSQAYMTFWKPEANVDQRKNTASQIRNVKEAAEAAGMVIEDSDVFFQPSTVVRLPAANDGTSFREIVDEANQRTNEQHPGLRDENFSEWLDKRNEIQDQVLEDHGGQREYTDAEIARHWERFTQELEAREGRTPAERTGFTIPEDEDLQTQLQTTQAERARLIRNRGIAARQGQPVEPIEQSLSELQQRRNEIRNQIQAEARREAGQQGTIEQALGQTVTMGQYTGELTTDTEGNIVIDTGQQIVEVPDTQKDTSLPLAETEVAVTPPIERTMQLTDAEEGRFQFTERDPLMDQVETEAEFTFLESNTNEAGEVVSVTMADTEGNQRTFRDPDVVEQVIWQQYFGQGVNVQPQVETLEQNITDQEQEMADQGEEAEFRLDDGDPRINTVFNKFEQGQQLTEDEQIEALDWIQQKMDQLEEQDPEDAGLMFNYLIAFENEILENNPQAPDTQQQRELEDEGQVSPATQETEDEGDGAVQLASSEQIAEVEATFIPEGIDPENTTEVALRREGYEPSTVDQFYTPPGSVRLDRPAPGGYTQSIVIKDGSITHRTMYKQFPATYNGNTIRAMLQRYPQTPGVTLWELVGSGQAIVLQSKENITDSQVIQRSGVSVMTTEQAEASPELPAHEMLQQDFITQRVESLTETQLANQEFLQDFIYSKAIPEHKEAVAHALENGQEVPESVLQAYPDLLDDTVTPSDQQSDPEGVSRTRRLVKDMTEEKFRQILSEETDLSPEQLDTVISLVRKRAQIWAKQNGRNESEYWRRRLSGIERTPPVRADQVQEVIDSYGDEVNSIEDLENQVRERLDYDPNEYEFIVESANGANAPYNSARQLGFFDEAPAEGTAVPNPATREIGQLPGEFAYQERVYYENEEWNFTAPKNIKSTKDAAWMFHELENMSVEHFFMVGVDAEGTAHNFHLGKGGIAATQVDVEIISQIVGEFDLRQVYLVHNHPSGQTRPSKADTTLYRRIGRMLDGTNARLMDGIIINRNSGYFGVFSPRTASEQTIQQVEGRRAFEQESPEYFETVQVGNYDRFQQLKNPKDFQNRKQVTSPRAAAQYADQSRFGITDRFSVMILDNSKRVLGLLHMNNQPDVDGPGDNNLLAMANEIRTYIGRLGGRSALLVTNQNQHTFRRHKGFINDLSRAMAKTNFQIDDVLSIAPTIDTGELYQSMKTDGVFEPVTEYAPYQSDTQVAEDGPSYRTGEEGIIELVEGTDDFTSVIKGLGKVFRQDLTGSDLSTIETWLNVEDGNWTAQQEDKFAEWFIKYLSEPEKTNVSDQVKAVFAKIKEWIAEVYKTLIQNDQGVSISSDIRQAFDSLFIDPTEELRNSSEVFSDVGMAINVNFKADGSEQTPGRFAVIEARDLQASHNTDGSLNSRHVISKGQPRDRRGRKYVAQHKEIAQKLNPASITGNGATAFYGSPTTNMRGEVIQGNGRSIALQIAYSENPGKATEYKDYLIAHAEEWGLSPEAIGSMQRPVLVRALDVKDNEAVRLGNIKNTDEAKMDPLDEAKASVRNMPEADRQRIGNIMNSSESETLRGILDDIGPQIIDLLPDISRAEYMDDENNITVKGKDFLTDVFRSLVFDSEQGRDTVRKFSEMPHDIIRGIERSYGTLIRYINTPADLSVTLQNAVDIVWNVRRNKNMNTASDFVNQQDVFAQGQEAYTDQEVQLAQVLLDVQRPSSALMKNLGTTGTQKAIRTLIRDYANRIDGETNLFESFDTPGNTPEGAEQAFQAAFVRTPESEEQQGQQPEELSSAAPSGVDVGFSNPTVNSSVRNTGVDHITDLEPIRAADISWISAEPTTKPARKLLKKINKDSTGEKVGMRSITNYFNDALGVEMRVGKENTTRRRPANMSPRSLLSRNRTALDVAVFHEAGHAIHFILQENEPLILDGFNFDRLMANLEENLLSRASAENNNEYFAEWVRTFIMNPEFASSLTLTDEILSVLEQRQPEIHDALLDTARLYQAHRARGRQAMLRSATKDRGPSKKSWWDKIKDTIDRFAFTGMGRNWVIEQLERKGVWKPFKAYYDSSQEAADKAREFLNDIRNTPADFRLAHQILNSIPSVVEKAVNGSGLSIFSTGDGVQITEDDLATLQEAGFNVDDDLAARLTDPDAEHGNLIEMSDSVKNIIEPVGAENWLEFEQYAQYKVSLERLIRKQARYPGQTEVSPQEVFRMVKDYEAVHPEWEGIFDNLNDYMDRLLLVAVLGGDKSVDEAVRMKQAYEFYMPLPRQLESRVESVRAGGVLKSDAGFRRISGEGDVPFVPLLTAIQQRTTQVVDAYYSNRAMLAPMYMAEEINKRDDLPNRVKFPLNRIMSPIRLDRQKVADLKPEEMAKVIADYLNDKQRREAAAEMGVEPGEIMMANPLTPDQINITTPSLPIWRAVEPSGVNIIAAKRNGQYEFFQVGMPHLYDYYARNTDPGGLGKFWNFIAKGTAPWKRVITTTLDFIFRNIPRDIFNSMFMGLPPEYTQEIPTKDKLKTMTPGWFLVTGLLEKWTGENADKITDTELLSRSIIDSVSPERRMNTNDFKDIMQRGIVIPGFFDMKPTEQIGELWGIANHVLMKPFELLLHYTGQAKMSTFFEEAPRAGAYRHAKKLGMSDEVAAMAHDFVSGNFGERPANPTVHSAYRSGGFINPATQIFSETVRRVFSPDPKIRGWAFATAFGSVATTTAVAWAISRMFTPDDRLEELEERTDSERANYMPLFGQYRVPFDYGPVGAVQSFTWITLDNMASENKLPSDEFAKAVLKRVLDTPVSAESPSGAVSTLMGMAVGPQATSIVESIANWKFYWEEPIVPPYMTNLPPEQQAYTTTPGFYKNVGEMTGWSPLKVQHTLNSMTGYLLGRTLAFKDKIDSGEPIKTADLPFGGKVKQRTPTGWYSQSAQRVSELDQQYQALQNEMDQLLEADYDNTDPERIRELASSIRKLESFHQATLRLKDMYKDVKDLRDAGKYQEAEALQKRMTEVAASILAQSPTNK